MFYSRSSYVWTVLLSKLILFSLLSLLLLLLISQLVLHRQAPTQPIELPYQTSLNPGLSHNMLH